GSRPPRGEGVPGSEGDVAGLRHEAVDHPVEDHAVISTIAREGAQPLGMQRRHLGQKFDLDRAVRRARNVEHEHVFRLLRHRRPGEPEGGGRCQHQPPHHAAPSMSAATRTRIIRSGLRGGSPRVIASTWSMPEITRPQTVYWLLRKCPSWSMMKNWLLPLSGLWLRAIPSMP